MQIIQLAASDATRYRALMLHAYEHAADAFTSTPAERASEPDSWWVNRVSNGLALTASFGAVEGQELVGTVALEFSSKLKIQHKALVVAMYVLPGRRGNGIGRALLLAAVSHCRMRDGVALLQLEVTHGNEAAVALYQSLGFQQFGLEPMAVFTPSGYQSKVHMWLALENNTNAA